MLWLATEYPHIFGAAWASSPDPVDFRRFQLVSAAAFALSVLFVALGIVGNLPGAVLYAAGSREPDARPTTP